jgi:hypothetical protein
MVERSAQTMTNAKLFWIGGQIVTCESKVPFKSMLRALLCADLMRGKFGKRLNPYRCPVCNEWHLTKDNERAKALPVGCNAPPVAGGLIDAMSYQKDRK